MLRPRSPPKTSAYPAALSRAASPTRPVSSASPSRPASSQGVYFEDDARHPCHAPSTSKGRAGSASREAVTRAEFWDVVLEDAESSNAILPWLGNLITDQSGISDDGEAMSPDGNSGGMVRTNTSGSISAIPSREPRPTASQPSGSAGNPAKFESQVQELVETERSYVRRIDALYNRYAKPLRQRARDRDGAIIPLYEAQRLFGNIGELLGANLAFLREMDGLLQGDRQGGGLDDALKSCIGEVVHRHMACFGCYNEYFGNFEKAKHIEQSMTRSNKAFRDFSDHVKQTTPNLGNVSIRELIMEPVQRIPRYKLLLDGLIKSLPSAYSSQRTRLEDAAVLCSRIASCEVDEKTQRAAVLWSFGRNVQGFPAGLFSVRRKFIDAIDVDDFPIDAPSAMFSPSAAVASRAVPCTLFLFDDSVLVAKRLSPTASGRRVLCLDDLNRLADEMKTFTERSGSSAQQTRKPELGFRGVSDIMDIQASDLGGSDFQLVLKRPPAHIHHEKWTGRPLRQYATLTDAQAASPARFEKMRFLENLWRAQALYKTREDRCHVRTTVIAASSPTTDSTMPDLAEARRIVYWNIYQRQMFLSEPHKSPTLLHVDFSQRSDPVPLGPDNQSPHAELRIHSIDEEYAECTYSVSSKHRAVDDDAFVIALDQLNARMRRLQDSLALQEDQMALHNFRPGESPSTPASHRGRVVAGLENFGRSLFTPGSIRSVDVFGSPKRKGSLLSKSSVASTMASDLFSNSGRSVSTAATSINSRDMLTMVGTGQASIDAAGKLMPPGGSPVSPHTARTRAQSAGPIEMAMSGSPGAALSNGPPSPHKTPRRPASQILDSVSPDQRESMDVTARPQSALSTYEDAQAIDTDAAVFLDAENRTPSAKRSGPSAHRPTGPRALSSQNITGPPTPSKAAFPTTSPRRKPVSALAYNGAHDSSDIPYTPTRRVPSGASKRSAPEAEPASPTRPSSKPKRTAPPTPPKDTKPMPLMPRVNGDLNNYLTAGVGVASTPRRAAGGTSELSTLPKHKTPNTSERSTLGLKGRVRRNLFRLDEGDKENSGALAELADELSELQGVTAALMPEIDSPTLRELTSRLEAWLADASDRCVDAKTTIDRVAGDVEALLRRLEEAEEARDAAQVAASNALTASLEQGFRDDGDGDGNGNAHSGSLGLSMSDEAASAELEQIKSKVQELEKRAAETEVLKTRCEALQRKCELLTALESDGRLENSELHKAFNEELDRLYEETMPDPASSASTGDDALQEAQNLNVRLRNEVKRSKAERNEAQARNRDLERKMRLMEGELECLKGRLQGAGML